MKSVEVKVGQVGNVQEDAKKAAQLELQQALQKATESGLLDDLANDVHLDTINQFCDGVDALIEQGNVQAVDDAREVLPGATSSEVLEVMMQDIVGDYDVPEQVPEWSWVESNASFAHVQNGTSGVWEFVLNLSCVEMDDVPEKLRPVISKAVADNIAYLIFHQGT